jgi:hypothetical protein
MTTVHVTAPMLAAYNHFLAVGFTENGAAAPVGNGCQESGEFLVATMFRAHPDWSGGVPEALKSGGFEEWMGDRKTACIAFIGRAETRLGVAKGSLLNDLGTQCDFVVYELQTNPRYLTLYRQLTTGSRSITNLTANFMAIYEVPALRTANLDNRIAHAEAVAARAREMKAAVPVPQPRAPATVPQAAAPEAPIPVPTAPASPPSLPTISPPAAGRITAVLDNLMALHTTYLAERASIDAEIAILETTIADFGKLQGAAPNPIPPLLQKPAAKPAVTPQPQGNPIMNPQVLATIRSILLAFGGAAVSKGVIDESTMTSLVGGATAAASFGWSLWTHSTTNTIAAAASLPEVQKIVTTPAIANSPKFAANDTVVAH